MKQDRCVVLGSLIAALLLLSPVPTVTAQDVLPGFDLWTTPPGGATHDFAGDPIPADFFGPGSDPFTGFVGFVGVPIPTHAGQPTGGADTIVERLAPAPLDGGPAAIPIELVALSLTSVSPITVTFNGGQNPEQWAIDVAVGGTAPSGGGMTITRADANGGTYDALMQICPIFTFTQLAPPNDQFVLDHCNGGGSLLNLTTTGATWQYLAVQPLISPLSGPNFFPVGPHVGPHPNADPLEEGMDAAAIPTTSEWGMIVLTLALIVGGALVLRRRVGTATA